MLNKLVPILRIFDEVKAKEFYVDYLGFAIDWEHRFEPEMPLYTQISKDNVSIHLSEHYGDCTPGSAIRIEVADIEAYHQQLLKKQYPYSRPGLESQPWGSNECSVSDPFGNRIIFFERVEGAN